MEMLDVAGITEDEAVARVNQYMKAAAGTEINGLRQLLQSVRAHCMAEVHAQDVPFDTQYDETLSIRVRRTMAGDLIGAIEGAEDVQAAARERLEAMQGEYIHGLSGREAQTMQNRTLREVYDYLGYETMWVTTTGECELCQRLNGMVVGAGSQFALNAQTSSLYPPIHKGCTCQIVGKVLQAGENGDIIEEPPHFKAETEVREWIHSDKCNKNIAEGQQRKHIVGTKEYKAYKEIYDQKNQHGPSILTIGEEEVKDIIAQYAGTGRIRIDDTRGWNGMEVITQYPNIIGTAINNLNGKKADTTVFKIHYGKKGVHIVPDYPSKKGGN